MPRNLPQPLVQAVTSNSYSPCILLDLTLKSGIVHVWSGVGALTWNGNSYLGVGDLGSIGDVTEGVAVKADGTTVTLSGIDATMLQDCLDDIQLGAPAKGWFGVISNGQLVGSPYQLFSGTVDKPIIPINADKIAITLNIENRMINLQRATNRRYTATDQNVYFPNDSGFDWVEKLEDAAFVWG